MHPTPDRLLENVPYKHTLMHRL
jgi:hypothetical protein